MAKLLINNTAVEAKEGTTILEAAKSAGVDIPHFCYHPRLSIAGNCRMCLVEVEGAKNPVISCKETVREGMKVLTESDVIKKARADVLEFILINHPLDCPVCDQAGECKLQDYYFKYSRRPSRLKCSKVKKEKAKVIGPNVILDQERCLECTRCVRFCEEISGEHQIGIYERGDRVAIDVMRGFSLNNKYSLCTTDLCPVGALTSIDFRFKKRAWLLESKPSICLGCATGCNVWIDHADSVVHRMRPRENEEINKSWMCDYGRTTYKSTLSANRILNPVIKKEGEHISSDWEESISVMNSLIKSGLAKEIVGVLSARASVEENEAVANYCKQKLGAKKILWAGNEMEEIFADNILRDADKNPNSKYVETIADGKLEKLNEDCGLVILDEPNGKFVDIIRSSNPAWVVVLSSEPVQKSFDADVIFPKASYLEQEGTFINKNGIKQEAKAVFKPLGESLSAVEICKKLIPSLL